MPAGWAILCCTIKKILWVKYNCQMNQSVLQNKSRVQNFNNIYEQHVDDASFLWLLRSYAVNQPHYTAEGLKELEQRLDAHLDALMLGIDEAWVCCQQALTLEGAGEVFTAAIIAFRSHDIEKIQQAVEVGLKNHEASNGLISALGWLPASLVHPWIKKFLSSKDINHKYLAIAACSIRREDPGAYLEKFLHREDCLQYRKLYARCLRLIGELRRQDLMPALNQAMSVDDQDVCFWANWSAILLGNKTAVNRLTPFVFTAGSYQQRAIQLVFRVLPVGQGQAWIARLLEDKTQIRNVIRAVGALGDPQAINWLIQQMHQPVLARIAGEAFTMITGIDIEQQQLSEEGGGQVVSPSDDPADDNVAMDEDGNLPWPKVDRVVQAWQQNGNRFTVGERYFMGQKIDPEHLKHQLNKACQRQRYAASLELVLVGAATVLPSVSMKSSA